MNPDHGETPARRISPCRQALILGAGAERKPMVDAAATGYNLWENPLRGEAGLGNPRAVIDLVHLARQSLGDQALELELLEMFDRQSARIVAQLTAVKSGDFKARGDFAHMLKGSALAIGANKVAQTAARLEALCANPPDDSLSAALADLAEAVTEARGAIAKLIA